MAIDEAHDPALARFKRRVVIDAATGCWNWTGRPSGGYGRIRVDGRRIQAHHFSYEIYVGPVPSGLVIDHLCQNQKCVNPEHLEAVTMRENILRGNSPMARQARQTHCLRGHELAGANVRLRGRRRECIACSKITSKASRARRAKAG